MQILHTPRIQKEIFQSFSLIPKYLGFFKSFFILSKYFLKMFNSLHKFNPYYSLEARNYEILVKIGRKNINLKRNFEN